MSDIAYKSEKLASAVYFITSFFTDQEPLKWKLRSVASETAGLGASFKHVSGESDSVTPALRRSVLELINLLRVAKNAGLISTTNHELIDQELNKYLSEITVSGDVSTMLTLPARASVPTPVHNMSLRSDKPEHIGHLPHVSTPRPSVENTTEKVALKDFGAVSVKKNSRQSVIIGLLKRKKEVMIKDITPLIRGCSEKTIQRELLSMVQSGVLKKEGEKRWSKYSLA